MGVLEYSNALLRLLICKRDTGVGLAVVVVTNTLEELVGNQIDGSSAIQNNLCRVAANFVVNTRRTSTSLCEILVFSGRFLCHFNSLGLGIVDRLY